MLVTVARRCSAQLVFISALMYCLRLSLETCLWTVACWQRNHTCASDQCYAYTALINLRTTLTTITIVVIPMHYRRQHRRSMHCSCLWTYVHTGLNQMLSLMPVLWQPVVTVARYGVQILAVWCWRLLALTTYHVGLYTSDTTSSTCLLNATVELHMQYVLTAIAIRCRLLLAKRYSRA
jgi:hypothetical protein